MNGIRASETTPNHIQHPNIAPDSQIAHAGARQSFSTSSSESLWVTPENVQHHMHSFFDKLFTRLMAVVENKINEKIALIRGAKQLSPENKTELINFFMKADSLDDLMNLEINKLEFSLRDDFSKWGSRESLLEPSNLLQGECANKRIERYCFTREQIRAEMEDYEENYRSRYLENVKHTYCKRFTESLPSLKAPGVGPTELNGDAEKHYNLLQSLGMQNSIYQDEKVHIHNADSYLARVDAETQKAINLQNLFENLQKSLEGSQDDDSNFDSQDA